jgi:hypothetical protein
MRKAPPPAATAPLALLAIVAGVASVAVACGGGNLASNLTAGPTLTPKGQARCGEARSQERPLIVEWPSSDRMTLETRARQGVVVVRYVGCDLEVLSRCRAPVKYGYTGGTRKIDKIVMKDADDLYANVPVGAAALEATLKRSGQLTVAMNLVGRYESADAIVGVDELQGECTGATHFVYGVTVGAFDFFAGGEASMGASANFLGAGAGAHSESERSSLSSDGDMTACEKATPDDKGPPAQCGALVRIEVVPLGQPKAPEPTCPGGTKWDGTKCTAGAGDSMVH